MQNHSFQSVVERFLNSSLGNLVEQVIKALPYIALPIIYFWYGGMKFTAYEANGIQPLVEHSLFISWMYNFMSVQGFSNFLGVMEISIGALILLRFASPKYSMIGGLLSAGLFFTTINMLFTVPGVAEPLAGGFPAISAGTGQFLLKDVGLFALSLYIAHDSACLYTENKKT